MERCNSLTDWYNRKRPQAVTCAHPPSVLMSPAWLVLQTRPANAFQERQPEQLRARPASQLHSPSVTSGVSAEHEHTGEWWAGRLQCAGTDAPSSSHIFQSAVPTHTCSIRKKKKKLRRRQEMRWFDPRCWLISTSLPAWEKARKHSAIRLLRATSEHQPSCLSNT